MKRDRPKRVREQVVVYLDERDVALLDQMTEQTGLAKTELFRRGLRRLAHETLGEERPGSSLRYLVATAGADPYPADVAARADDYLYGRGYEEQESAREPAAKPAREPAAKPSKKPATKKRARSR